MSKTDPPILLIADDDSVLRMIMCQSFKPLGFKIIQAEDGREACKLFEQEQPDMVILDVKMPLMNGFDVCQFIRSHPGGQFTPVLITTGLDDDISIHRAYEVGATDFILKPFNWTVINHRIRYILRSAHLLQSLNEMQNKNETLINAFPDRVISFTGAEDAQDFSQIELHQAQHHDSIPTFPPVFKKKFMRHIQHLKRSHQVEVFQYSEEFHNHKKFFEVRLVKETQNNIIAIIRDITEIKNQELKLKKYAFYDELTSLPNRQYLNQTLQDMLTQHERYQNICVCFIDLDRFKKINDTFGHSIGDQILVTIANQLNRTLTEAILESDLDEKSFLARFGGDEFVLVIPNVLEKNTIRVMAQSIVQLFEQPLPCKGRDFYVTPSIGLALSPQHGQTAESLIKHADVAMYYSKQEGRNRFHFYDPRMNADDLARLDLETALRRAIEQKELLIEYQPQYNLSTHALSGVEALIRWIHPKLGLIGPNAFIPIAEEIGLINQISHLVLEESIKQCALFNQHGVLKHMSINLSISDLRDRALPARLFDLFSQYHVQPNQITVELTESIFMDKDSVCQEVLQRIAGLGVLIAIDDFGKGYSSLSYIKHFPVHILKIDKSFVEHVKDSVSDRNIIKAIIKMAHAMDLKVVAEGVETLEQLDILKQHHCDYVQGFYFSRPVSAEVICQILDQQSKNAKDSSK